jgi:hypothetical protein
MVTGTAVATRTLISESGSGRWTQAGTCADSHPGKPWKSAGASTVQINRKLAQNTRWQPGSTSDSPDITAIFRWHGACCLFITRSTQSQVTPMTQANPPKKPHSISNPAASVSSPAQFNHTADRETRTVKPQDVWNWPHKPRVLASDKMA